MDTNEKQTQQIGSTDFDYKVHISYGSTGNNIILDITLPYESFTTIQDIGDCGECPIGYNRTGYKLDPNSGCGKQVPVKSGCRPETCRLNIKTLSDVLRQLADKLDVERMINGSTSGGSWWQRWLI